MCTIHPKLPHYLYPSAITLPPVLKLSFMPFSLSFSHLSSLSSGELMCLIKGRVFKGFSTSDVLFWPENPWQKLHSIFPTHNLFCFILFRKLWSQLIGCQQNNLVEEGTRGDFFFFFFCQWGNARLCETSESITVTETESVEEGMSMCVCVCLKCDKDLLSSHNPKMRKNKDNSSFSWFIVMS